MVAAPGKGVRDFPLTFALAVLAIVATATRAPWMLADGHTWTEPWRALTGPLVHATWGHLVRDLALVLIVGVVYERPMRRVWPALLAAGIALPALAVLALTGASSYQGLSGLSHALLAAAIVFELRGKLRGLAMVVGLGLWAKVIYELWTGTPAFPMDLGAGVRQVPLAHFVGAACGAILALGATASDPVPARR